MFRLSRFIILLTFTAVILAAPRWFLNWRYSGDVSEPDEAPTGSIAIVFGAGLRRDGQPTAILADRVQIAVQLYIKGNVEKLLMSGSAREDGYDEPQAMRTLAISLGVSPEDILVDPGGDRTFTTCLRARDEFGITSALLVSQSYHLPRALVLCDVLGIDAKGVASDLREYSAQTFMSVRETIATFRALWDAGKYKWFTVEKTTANIVF